MSSKDGEGAAQSNVCSARSDADGPVRLAPRGNSVAWDRWRRYEGARRPILSPGRFKVVTSTEQGEHGTLASIHPQIPRERHCLLSLTTTPALALVPRNSRYRPAPVERPLIGREPRPSPSHPCNMGVHRRPEREERGQKAAGEGPPATLACPQTPA